MEALLFSLLSLKWSTLHEVSITSLISDLDPGEFEIAIATSLLVTGTTLCNLVDPDLVGESDMAIFFDWKLLDRVFCSPGLLAVGCDNKSEVWEFSVVAYKGDIKQITVTIILH